MSQEKSGSGCLSGCMMMLMLSAAIALLSAFIVAVWTVAGAVVVYDMAVVSEPGEHLDRNRIMATIAAESSVTYQDGHKRVGVFFEGQHRETMEPEALPAAFAFAIVAAEDGLFWHHIGIDPVGITRAMAQNVAAGRVVAGGSTLTQQTAKNVFHRKDRSLKSKLEEALNTLRLEAHFDKREILAFYANQFHVTGNGRGLGIAARYFFDVERPADLTVLQSAYIAGLVKGPSNYDPFLGDAERRKRALVRAHERTRYVLRRIVSETPSSLLGPFRPKKLEAVQAEAQRLLDEGFELPFRRGSFRYDRSVVLDEVGRRLTLPPISEALHDAGVDNPETAGLVVRTTLDADAQREATYGLWHHLTEVGTALEAIEPGAFVSNKGTLRFDPTAPLTKHGFYRARVTTRSDNAVDLDLGGRSCSVDRAGLDRIAKAVASGAAKSTRARATTQGRRALVDVLTEGSYVLASVRQTTPAPLCDLEVRPVLQGAVTVVQHGQLRAMVGGNDDRDFNRARAGRQMGSTWKPLLFHAAMTLGWTPGDVLDNWQNAFPYRGVFYYPGADHKPQPEVNIAVAGIRSENVASIWLLYHLVDRLEPAQQIALGRALEVFPAEGEHALGPSLQERLDKAGIRLSQRHLDEAAFEAARAAVRSRLDTAAHPEDALALDSMLYGAGFSAELARAEKEPEADRDWKRMVLGHSWLSLERRLAECTTQYRALQRALQEQRTPRPGESDGLTVSVEGDVVQIHCSEWAPPEGTEALSHTLLEPLFAAQPTARPAPAAPVRPTPRPAPPPTRDAKGRKRKNRGQQPAPSPRPQPVEEDPWRQPWSTDVPTWGQGRRLAPEHDMVVEGRLHASTLTSLQHAMTPVTTDLHTPETAVALADVRALLSIRYVVALARKFGVSSHIEEVLPMPLGASEITLEEATTLYEGITTSTRWGPVATDATGSVQEGHTDPTLLITEIKDTTGRVIYTATTEPEPISRPEVGEMLADILRSVVEWGTGRRALRSSTAGVADVPLGGKTGTTNDFRNAAFLGFAPRAGVDGFTMGEGYALGAYVGYDDNRSMKSGGVVLAGASGALPSWRLTAQGMADAGLLGHLDRRPAERRLLFSPALTRTMAPDQTPVLTWLEETPEFALPPFLEPIP